MMKFFAEEFNKDDRDYKRFFQSRNVSLATYGRKIEWYENKETSGRKLKFTDDSFFPIIAKKMIQKV